MIPESDITLSDEAKHPSAYQSASSMWTLSSLYHFASNGNTGLVPTDSIGDYQMMGTILGTERKGDGVGDSG
jgi:hypothetical protein